MSRKFISIIVFSLFISLSCFTISANNNPGEIYIGNETISYRNVTVYAPAVATTDNGYIGVISTVTVTIQSNGSGRVFVDTHPLTQVDMQGSARLAVKVASSIVKNDEACTSNPDNYDYFFVVRTEAPIIGGPSAGGIMTVATVALLENLKMQNDTVMTGMINPDGSIGPIGGIPQKIDAAYSVGANRFLIPKGQSTYTEVVVDRSSWVSISKTVTKTVDEYVDEMNYNIEVKEVTDVYDALVYYTGVDFSSEVTTEDISTEEYINSIKPLADTLIKTASENYNISEELLESSEIKNVRGFRYTEYYRDFVEGKLNSALNRLNESREWYGKKQYYTSTSKSFQSLIYSRFVRYICEYYNTSDDNKVPYIENLLDNSTTLYDDTFETAKNSEIKGYITLQSVGAAQRRVSEAREIIEELKTEYENNNIITFWDVISLLENLSFADERLNSVEWWIGIGLAFNDTEEISIQTIENLALEYIGEAQQSAYYSSILLDEMGSSDYTSLLYLNAAEGLIDTAQDDFDRNLTSAALFEALEALVNANLAIEIIGTNSEDKLDIASENANKNIAKLRKENIEPVLAVSYYEFAENLRNESSYSSALTYYKYSGMIAGALGFTNLSCGTGNSRFIGVPEINYPQNNVFFGEIVFVLYGLILGGIGGIGVGLLIAGVSSNKNKKQRNRSVEKKVLINRNKENYPNNEIPRSIKDYYKKNK